MESRKSYSKLHSSHSSSPRHSYELRHQEFFDSDSELNRVIDILCEGNASSSHNSLMPIVNHESHKNDVGENIDCDHEVRDLQENFTEKDKKNKFCKNSEEGYLGFLYQEPNVIEKEKHTNRNISFTEKSSINNESKLQRAPSIKSHIRETSSINTNHKILEFGKIDSSKSSRHSNLKEYDIFYNEEPLESNPAISKREIPNAYQFSKISSENFRIGENAYIGNNQKKLKYEKKYSKAHSNRTITRKIPEEDKTDYIKPLDSQELWSKRENAHSPIDSGQNPFHVIESRATLEIKSNHFHTNSNMHLLEIPNINNEEGQDYVGDYNSQIQKREKTIKALNRKSYHPRSYTLDTNSRRCIINLSSPGNIEFAEKHSKANEIMKLSGKDIKKAERCECCHMPLDQEKFPLFRSTDQLKELGSSFPLYFHMVKLMLISHMVCFFFACLPCMIENRIAGRVGEWGSNYSFNLITPASFGTKEEISIWQPILHVIVCIFLMLFYLYILKTIQEKSIEIDIQTTTPSDFTLFLKNLPKEYTIEELTKHITENFCDNKNIIVNVARAYDIGEYFQCEEECTKWELKLNFLLKYYEKYNREPKQSHCFKKFPYESVESCNEMIESYSKKLYFYYNELIIKKSTQFAFVTFNSQISTREIAKLWEKSFIDSFLKCICNRKPPKIFLFKDSYIKARIACESPDVNWENLGVTKLKKIFIRTTTLILNLFLMVTTFLILYYALDWKRNQNAKNKYGSLENLRGATALAAVVATLINIFISKLLRVFSALEKHRSWSSCKISVMNRIVSFTFTNTIFLLIMLYSLPDNQWFVEGGLVYSVFWLQISNAFVPPLVYLVNPSYQYQKFIRYWVRRKSEAKLLQMTQREANDLFKGPEVDLADRFGNIIKTCFLSFFFAPISPIGPAIGIFALLVEAGVFNFMLVRIHCRPRAYNGKLVINAVQMFPWVILVYSVGILVFFYFLRRDVYWLLYIAVILASINLVASRFYYQLPWLKDRTIEKLKELTTNNAVVDSFFENLPNFINDYERDNPVTSAQGLIRWKKFITTKNDREYIDGMASYSCSANYPRRSSVFNTSLNQNP